MTALNAAAASNAMRNLQLINRDMTATQGRISTGLKVASARDNATVWTAATNIRADIAKQDKLESDLTLAKGRADVTLESLSKIKDILGKMKTIASELVDAADGHADEAKNIAVAARLEPYKSQLKAIAASGSFQGANWLKDTGASNIVLSTNNGADVTYSFTPTQLLDAANTSGTLANVLTISGNNGASAYTKAGEQGYIDTAISAIDTYTATVAGLSDTITMQQDFLTKLDGIRQTALSQLVDADMTEESAKLSALQVREQLTYQALSMINASQQNVLRLFQ